ncbi:MAG: peptidase S16 [Gammaproteobacteria bacterium]|nr:peptidase S16 [Gammaproteobacteria bacterium]
MINRVPLFPLNTVMFPGGVLPLRIFEPRYLDMVSDCLRNDTPIGVVLIREGQEVGRAADTYDMGTLSIISYWNRRQDGLLGITLRGTQRFRILSHDVMPNQLVIAEVEALPTPQPIQVHNKYQTMASLLRKIIAQLEPPYTTMPAHYDDLEWVSARLCEFLPMPLDYKQQLLECDDIISRIEQLYMMMQRSEVG